MKCALCNEEITPGAKFCSNCGNPVPNGSSIDNRSQATNASGNNPTIDNAPAVISKTDPTNNAIQTNPPQQFKAAVASSRKRNMSKVSMIALIVLVTLLVSSVAYAAYYAVTTFVLPQVEQANALTIEAETISEDIALADDPTGSTYSSPSSTTFTYMQLNASRQNDAVDKINATLKADYDNAVRIATTTLDINDLNASENGYSSTRDYNMTRTYLSDTIVSFERAEYNTNFGPHGWIDTIGMTFSLETGEQIDPVAEFGLTDAQLSAATNKALTTCAINDGLDTSMLYLSDTTIFAEQNGDHPSYFITEDGLVYATHPYEMGYYAAGYRWLIVQGFNGDTSQIGTNIMSS